MNILFHSNCQGGGLKWFMERSPEAAKMHIELVQGFQIALGECTREQEKAAVEKADVIFYHLVGLTTPWPDDVKPKDGVELIPLSVFYNGGYFLHHAEEEDWRPLVEHAEKYGIEAAAHVATHEADMGYERRWQSNIQRMAEKEIEGLVPLEHCISDWSLQGKTERQNITMNHPTSIIFLPWANMLLRHLGLKQMTDDWQLRAREDINLVGLPCCEHAGTGAVKHLGLSWGGSAGDNEACVMVATEILAKLLKQE